jgi:anaerobic selenocysteine-containing dehydrogenase
MDEVKQVRTICRSCHGGCGIIATVKGGKVVKVEGDPGSPISHGSLCSKGLAITQLAYHPDRILHPMKKPLANGSGFPGTKLWIRLPANSNKPRKNTARNPF